MRILSCSLQNFASYKILEFNFENQGLTLIQGPTGSGKSTLCDAVPWILFGRTSKDGTVDEVISWNAEGPTTGTVVVQLNTSRFTITRSRNTNDLYFELPDGLGIKRGKDLNDTQKLISNLLGIDSALYLSGAYFHEFSQTAQFFATTAKNRRVLCEQLVDLSLAKNLQLDLTNSKKELAIKSQEYANKIQSYADHIQYLARHNDYLEKSENFELDKAASLQSIDREINKLRASIRPASFFHEEAENIEQVKKTIGDDTCSECGSALNSKAHNRVLTMEHDLRQMRDENNRNRARLLQLDAAWDKELKSENIYAQLISDAQQERDSTKLSMNSIKSLDAANSLNIADHDLLLEIVNAFRGALIQNAIQSLESSTNNLLTDYFDAEIRVIFTAEEADKLAVIITKDGNACSYTQLSKGQRQLLKMCFGVSVMKAVSNHHGISFNAIFFDELTDGLDENMKAKTYRLLEGLALEYESIFLVDHSESLKTMFINKYDVSLVNGNSLIEKS